MPEEGPIATSFRMSREGHRLLRELATYHGIRSTSALEMIIREAARSRGLAPSTTAPESTGAAA